MLQKYEYQNYKNPICILGSVTISDCIIKSYYKFIEYLTVGAYLTNNLGHFRKH